MLITFFSEKRGCKIGIGDLSVVVPQSCTVMMKVPNLLQWCKWLIC